MKKVKWAALVILICVLALIVFQNTGTVQAHFLGFTAEMSLVVLLFLTGALGFISGILLGFWVKSDKRKSADKRQDIAE